MAALATFGALAAQDAATKPQPAGARSKPSALVSADFNTNVADALVGHLAAGISARSSRITLSVFDKERAESFAQTREQLNDWFAQTLLIRLHYKITDWSADGTIQAHFQLEQYPLTENFPATHKDIDVVLHAARSKDGWRIVNYEPADLFLP